MQQQTAPGRVVFAGVDWAENSHVVCLVDGDGQVIVSGGGRACRQRDVGRSGAADLSQAVGMRAP